MTDIQSDILPEVTTVPVNLVTQAAKPGRKSNADINAEMRARAARQAAKDATPVAPDQIVTVRVLPLGADKISMGVHVAGVGEACYERGETFETARGIAIELEQRGYVEIK